MEVSKCLRFGIDFTFDILTLKHVENIHLRRGLVLPGAWAPSPSWSKFPIYTHCIIRSSLGTGVRDL